MSLQTHPIGRRHGTPAHTQDPASAGPAMAWGALVRHYLEMVVTMVVGMVVLLVASEAPRGRLS